jgi:hypothetical protein
MGVRRRILPEHSVGDGGHDAEKRGPSDPLLPPCQLDSDLAEVAGSQSFEAVPPNAVVIEPGLQTGHAPCRDVALDRVARSGRGTRLEKKAAEDSAVDPTGLAPSSAHDLRELSNRNGAISECSDRSAAPQDRRERQLFRSSVARQRAVPSTGILLVDVRLRIDRLPFRKMGRDFPWIGRVRNVASDEVAVRRREAVPPCSRDRSGRSAPRRNEKAPVAKLADRSSNRPRRVRSEAARDGSRRSRLTEGLENSNVMRRRHNAAAPQKILEEKVLLPPVGDDVGAADELHSYEMLIVSVLCSLS